MQDTLRVCIVQMTSTVRYEGNIEFVERAVAYAKSRQCQLVALPEVAGLMNKDASDVRHQISHCADDPFVSACSALARQHGLWIHTGSTPAIYDSERLYNQTALIDHTGVIRAHYNKIHLFDVCIEGKSPIRESDRYAPGTQAVLAKTPWGDWGMSICYDLRFPQLYRDYAKAGATICFAPSAFTRHTGAAHWEVLLRARAIENGCFMIAAAQVGTHDDGRRTWGHSMVVDPWGEVLVDIPGDEPAMEVVDLDLMQVSSAREQIPSLLNERSFTFDV